MNKIVVISNERFEKGLIAFINSYRNVNMKTPLVIIDTGLKGTYPYETIKINPEKFLGNYKKAEWMTDCSPYLQLWLSELVPDSDKIIYMEVDMLLLKNIDHIFSYISDNNFIAVMDDAAKASIESINNGFYIDSASRYFVEGSELRKKYKYNKGYNGGLIGATKEQYQKMLRAYKLFIIDEKQYRLLAQSFLNQYFIDEQIYVKDIGLEYNFSGINEYYDKEWLYDIIFNIGWKGPSVLFNNIDISVLHFTGKQKPFLIYDENDLTAIWRFYYNKGVLFNV
jgi:lipopolysaccharide biosynthesis glycosyltransferase